jgi:hypothetical protein
VARRNWNSRPRAVYRSIGDADDIELVRRMHELDFGHVEPDYSNEDPKFEKY